MALGKVTSVAGTFGSYLGFFIKSKTTIVFLIFILLSAIMGGIQNKSIEYSINDLGSRLITPSIKIQNFTSEIINNKGLIVVKNTTFSKIMEYGILLFNIFSQIYIIVLWIMLLSWISSFIVLRDSSQRLGALMVGIILFLGIQITYISISKLGNPLSPIYMFRDLWIALGYLIKPMSEIAEKIV